MLVRFKEEVKVRPSYQKWARDNKVDLHAVYEAVGDIDAGYTLLMEKGFHPWFPGYEIEVYRPPLDLSLERWM